MKAENRSGVQPSSILHAIRSLRGIFCDPMLIRDGRFTGEPSSPLERHTLHGHERSAEHGGRLRREPVDGSNAADPMRLARARTRPSHADCSTRKLHVRHRPTARARSRCKPTAHCVSEAASDAVRLSKEDFRGFRSDLFDEETRVLSPWITSIHANERRRHSGNLCAELEPRRSARPPICRPNSRMN